MVRDHFRKERRCVVVDLRRESHQLSLFKSELTKILDVGTFDHTIAAFWYFVILSEVLLSLRKELDYQASQHSEAFANVQEINAALRRLEISASGDFTARINRLGSYVIQEIKAKAETNERLSPEKLTNIVFRSGIAEAKRPVVKHCWSRWKK
jgi:hypothetical protein